MNYELAKQLEQAGFPQKKVGLYSFQNGYFCDLEEAAHSVLAVGHSAYLPTLEELIEACGENFKTLDHLPDQNRFVAYSADSIDIDRDGITPTKAVAKLWLALNKK